MCSGNGRIRVPTSRGPITPHVHSDNSTTDPEAEPIIIEMPTNAAAAGYFSALKGFCEFPALNQLEADQNECFVCREPFNEGTEPPIKLACSHVFGMTCINIWALDKMDQGDDPDCPICRAHLLSAEGVVPLVVSILPRRGTVLTEVEQRWVPQVNELWKKFSEDVQVLLKERDIHRAVPGLHFRHKYLHGRTDSRRLILTMELATNYVVNAGFFTGFDSDGDDAMEVDPNEGATNVAGPIEEDSSGPGSNGEEHHEGEPIEENSSEQESNREDDQEGEPIEEESSAQQSSEQESGGQESSGQGSGQAEHWLAHAIELWEKFADDVEVLLNDYDLMVLSEKHDDGAGTACWNTQITSVNGS
ncbi:MAG: hypothetical protein Q9172_000847 [Xanthocarpia lactea]